MTRFLPRLLGLALSAAAASSCRAHAAPQRAGAASATASTGVAETLRPFTGDTAKARLGRFVFLEYNCYSCHGGLAGGAMGPSLRDTVWKYGGSDSAIYHSIHDGRPMGMPTWGGMLTDSQIGDVITYIHSLRTTAEPKFFFWARMDTAAARRIASRAN